jgi:uncharacterized protein (DUF58 family)
MNDELTHEILHFIDRIDWRSLLRSQQWLSGRHTSLRKGASPEFKEYREHRSGEDVHSIDWKASARSKFPLVREKEHQGVLKQWLWLDNSASMDFPASPFNKFRRLKILSGALLYMFQSIGDRFGVAFESAQGISLSIPTRGQMALQEQIARVADSEVLPKAFSSNLLNDLKPHLKQPSSLWFLSDFDAEPKAILKELIQIQKAGHEVRVLHLYHPEEEVLRWQGPHVFMDAEGVYAELSLMPDQLRTAYAQQYQQHCRQIETLCQEGQLNYLRLNVCDAPETWLAHLLTTLPAR